MYVIIKTCALIKKKTVLFAIEGKHFRPKNCAFIMQSDNHRNQIPDPVPVDLFYPSVKIQKARSLKTELASHLFHS